MFNWVRSLIHATTASNQDVAPPTSCLAVPVQVAPSQNNALKKLTPFTVDGEINFQRVYQSLYREGQSFSSILDSLAEELDGRWFPSKVAGVSHRNADRTSRQAAIKKMDIFESLELRPEPDNKFDPNAIAVINEQEKQIGYLNARLAGEVARAMRRGVRFHCFVTDITGEFEPTRGVNIAVLRWEQAVSPAVVSSRS